MTQFAMTFIGLSFIFLMVPKIAFCFSVVLMLPPTGSSFKTLIHDYYPPSPPSPSVCDGFCICHHRNVKAIVLRLLQQDARVSGAVVRIAESGCLYS